VPTIAAKHTALFGPAMGATFAADDFLSLSISIKPVGGGAVDAGTARVEQLGEKSEVIKH